MGKKTATSSDKITMYQKKSIFLEFLVTIPYSYCLEQKNRPEKMTNYWLRVNEEESTEVRQRDLVGKKMNVFTFTNESLTEMSTCLLFSLSLSIQLWAVIAATAAVLSISQLSLTNMYIVVKVMIVPVLINHS